ncbi:MAG: hypothetical protein ACLTMP_10495 [Eggerthella lenta]
MHHGTRAVLEAQGIDCSGKTACRLRRADADEWDLFVGMDEANMRHASPAGTAAESVASAARVRRSARDVADPGTQAISTSRTTTLAGCAGLRVVDSGAPRS